MSWKASSLEKPNSHDFSQAAIYHPLTSKKLKNLFGCSKVSASSRFAFPLRFFLPFSIMVLGWRIQGRDMITKARNSYHTLRISLFWETARLLKSLTSSTVFSRFTYESFDSFSARSEIVLIHVKSCSIRSAAENHKLRKIESHERRGKVSNRKFWKLNSWCDMSLSNNVDCAGYCRCELIISES